MTSSLEPERGAVLGRYVVEGVIGRGGAGIVVTAVDRELGKRVALKLLRRELVGNPDARARFVREARTTEGLRSERVVRVLDAGVLDSGTPFLAMELLEGLDLRAIVRLAGRLPVALAADYVRQACEPLAEAHALGIVHRDVKPSNLFLTRSAAGAPLVKLLDFGLSKTLKIASKGLTVSRQVIGSPLYMSPEQIRSPREVDSRTDVWALGVVLYTLLTGRTPFRARHSVDAWRAILTEEVKPASARRASLPPGLDAVIASCLRRDIEQRTPSARALADALAPFAREVSPCP